MYRICWVSDSELESISIDRDFSDFSLNRFSSVIDSTILGYGTDSYLDDDLNPHKNLRV